MWQGNDKAAFHWRGKPSKGPAPHTWQKPFNSDVRWEMLGGGRCWGMGVGETPLLASSSPGDPLDSFAAL